MKNGRQESRTSSAVREIRKAEEEAGRRIKEARDKVSAGILQKAYDRAKAVKDERLAKAREEAQKNRNSIIHEAQNEARKIRQKGEEDIKMLQERVKAQKSEAEKKAAEMIKKYIQGDLS
ncbi:MAG: hypothetical protein JXB26_10455 [Candidatus Aminicenantes bacterium]|nr:hypothetical protein [Candidatus Aminicenantes bacterium]